MLRVLDGEGADFPQVETILAVESVPRYRTLICELEEYPAEVECSHLEEQVESFLQEGAVQYMSCHHSLGVTGATLNTRNASS